MSTVGVTKITVIEDTLCKGPDTVLLTLDLIAPMYPFKEPPQAKVLCANRDGVAWVRENFPGVRLVGTNSGITSNLFSSKRILSGRRNQSIGKLPKWSHI